MNAPVKPGGAAVTGAVALESVSLPSNLRGHVPALDGMRGLAVMMVLIFHFVGQMLPTNGVERAIVGVTKHGLLGVDLFFVLSGFLITGLLYEAHDKPHYLRNFYMRRVLRIFPLYYGVLALVFFVAPLIPPLRGATLDYLLDRQAWAWLYGINVYLAGHEEWSFSYLNHFWSLCVEEHFYLLVPLVVALLTLIPRRSFRLCALVALWVAGFAVRYAVYASRPAWTASTMTLGIWVKTHTRFDLLAAGVLVASAQRDYGPELREALRDRRLRWGLVALSLGCLALLMGPLARRFDLSTVFSWGTLTSVMYASVLLLVANTDGPLTRFLSSRALMLFATLGYGMYLVHPPVAAGVAVPFAAALLRRHVPFLLAWVAGNLVLLVSAAAAAYVLHIVVEKPALWLRGRLFPSRSRQRA
jgi:peptidoglycan/LPS O-acetylase OafA/YrhL